MKHFSKLFILLLLAAFHLPASSVITLDEAVASAMENNTDLATAQVSLQTAIRNNSLSSSFIPDISIEGGVSLSGMSIAERSSGTFGTDIAIISLDMSDTDGFQLLKTMKQKYDFPVIVITERKGESDRILSFELGCEDFLIKPISKKELVLRINVIFRRLNREENSEDHNLNTWKLRNSQLTQNTRSHKFYLDGKPLELTNAEWRVLSYLCTNAGILLTREQIIDNCFDYRSDSYDRIVDTHVKNIRKMLGSYAQEWIETVRGYGYRFSGQPVRA